jgi:hypothetical protein
VGEQAEHRRLVEVCETGLVVDLADDAVLGGLAAG